MSFLTDLREMHTKVAFSRHTILCAWALGDLEFWSAAEKLQMTAAWHSQTALPERRLCDVCINGFSQKSVSAKYFKTFYLYVHVASKELLCVRSCDVSSLSAEMHFVYQELYKENCPPLCAITVFS
jgi:hypothetical protein